MLLKLDWVCIGQCKKLKETEGKDEINTAVTRENGKKSYRTSLRLK